MTVPRSLRLRFYAYQLTHSNGFYLPLSILYLQRVKEFGLADIGLVLGAFSIAMLVAEVPTGYLGDRLGRRATLALSNALSAAFMFGYVLAETPMAYVALHAMWAFGWAFRSGTRDAWLYELLAGHGAGDAFARVSGRATSVELAFEAGSAVAAGVLATVAWPLPFLANGVVAALGLPLLLTLPATNGGTDSEAGTAGAPAGAETNGDGRDAPPASDDPLTVADALGALRLQVGRPSIRWFVAYAAIFGALFSVTRSFEQPALDSVGVAVGTLGVLYAAFKLVSAGVAALVGPLEERVGVRGVFALLPVVYAVGWAAISLDPAVVVALLFLNRGLYRVMRPLRNHYLNARLPDVGRATVLSGASMVFSLAAGLAKFAAGALAASVGLLPFLAGAGVVAGILGGALWLATRPVRPVGSTPPVGAGAAS